MSLYARYVEEREGLSTLETDMGFVTYVFRPTDCYIKDIYVIPEQRKNGAASKMADEVASIAKKAGHRILTGSVDERAKGSEASDKVLRAYGMQPYTKEGFVTYYFKEIS